MTTIVPCAHALLNFQGGLQIRPALEGAVNQSYPCLHLCLDHAKNFLGLQLGLHSTLLQPVALSRELQAGCLQPTSLTSLGGGWCCLPLDGALPQQLLDLACSSAQSS